MEAPNGRNLLTLAGGLVLLWVVLVTTSVPGIFTIDEASQIVSITQLRNGDFRIPGTDGITPTPELLFFDPTARSRIGNLSFMGSTAPPLYAILALPFSVFGFRGLIALNALAFVASGLCVFWLAARRAKDGRTPWIALVTYLVGAYSIEYAQGLWPHALSAALATGGFCLAVRARDADGPGPAALAGIVLGFAAGVRYQNVVFAAAVGLGLLLWSRRRVASSLIFTAAFCIPLLGSSWMNHARLGSWNPISKGPTYLAIRAGRSVGTIGVEAVQVLVAKVVDYSFHPVPDDPIVEITNWWQRVPDTGATIFLGALKKAWLQSSPWLMLSLAALGATWVRREPEGRAIDLRAASLVVGATLGSFAIAGFGRHDGVCFNQRYFLELMPLGAVAAAWVLEGRPLPARGLLAGAAAGGLAVVALLLFDVTRSTEAQLIGLRAPLVLAIAVLVSASSTAVARRAPGALAFFFAASVAWAAAIHLGEDVVASRGRRSMKRSYAEYVGGLLPNGPAALVAQKSAADLYAPLLLDHDLVILDTWVDLGASTGRTVRELRAQGRRVFLSPVGVSVPFVETLVKEFGGRPVVTAGSLPVLELDPPDAPPSGRVPSPRQP